MKKWPAAILVMVIMVVSTTTWAFLNNSLLSASAPGTPASPTASLTCTSPSPCTITSGSSATLTWSSTNASSCTGTGFSTGGATSGTASVSPTTTTTYSINCSGATASATVTVTGGGSTFTCDIGPPFTGSVPHYAQEAGYTHCVANLDWTYTPSFTNNGNTYTWTSPSSWLDACGSGSPIVYRKSNNGAWPCGDVAFINDSANGGATQVLQGSWTVSDYNSGIYSFWLALSSEHTNGSGVFPGIFLSQGFYVEAKARVTTATPANCPSGGCIYFDIWDYNQNTNTPCGSCSTTMEFDFIEMFGGGGTTPYIDGSSRVSRWGPINGFTVDAYHIYAGLATVLNSGGTNYATCSFFDGQLYVNGSTASTCQSGSFASNDLGQTSVMYPLNVGVTGGPPYTPQGTMVGLEQYYQIWSCASYASGICYSSSLVTNP